MTKPVKVVELPDQGYTITVKGRHVLVTDPMKEYAIEKLSKVERFSDQIIEATVTMDIQKLVHKVTVVLKVGHTKVMVQASTEDMYASIDKAIDRLKAKLLKYKTRLKDHQAKGIKAVEMDVLVLNASALDDVNDAIEEETARKLEKESKPHEIVSTEKRPLKILTAEEAVMKMDLSNDTFRVYRSEEDQKLKIIYRRSDGNYAVIVPE